LKTLILGLGNPILCDDGVGIVVAEELRRTLHRDDVVVDQASVGGLGLLDRVEGYERVIIVDAIKTVDGLPGQVRRLAPDQFHGSLRAASSHDITFDTALELGRKLRREIPQEVLILAVEAADVETFGEALTPAVAAVVPKVVELVLKEISGPEHTGPDPQSP
jgi:hydrogenase maturation protease